MHPRHDVKSRIPCSSIHVKDWPTSGIAMLILRRLLWYMFVMICLFMNTASSAFSTKKFVKGLLLGHALGTKKFGHYDSHYFQQAHMMPYPYPVPYPMQPLISPISSSVATSSVAVATPNALPMTLPMIAPGVGSILPGGFAANGAIGLNGFGLAGGAAINPFGLNLLPQGVINPFGFNGINPL